ncbi:MAG: hypothetical protein M1831_004644 [Alyxoria varia]|nr:MAG: hypothetical protein M1831_004644 [Alyxoria varia]
MSREDVKHSRDGINAELSARNGWTPSSWKTKSIHQPVTYSPSTQSILSQSLSKLSTLPPLVTPFEIHKLRRSLSDVAHGKAFLLQGGDCAELFSYCEAENIDAKIKLLLQMSLVLIGAMNKPVVRIARLAGQYAKPRSNPTEISPDGQNQIPSFRGDILNGYGFDERELDPHRLVDAYFHSAATLNHIRAQLSSGIADLHNPLDWNLGHVRDQELQSKYQTLVNQITNSLGFLRTVGGDTAGPLRTVDLYTSHESLLLEYEQSLTRQMAQPERTNPVDFHSNDRNQKGFGPHPKYYATSAHFLWVGDRTRQIDGAHVEYLRGLENPIGIKVGPSILESDLVALLEALNPNKDPGKITLITRYGASQIHSKLPSHIDAVRRAGYAPPAVIWQCDPMHGNTKSVGGDKTKTREFEDIIAEVAAAIQIHKGKGSFLGGVHLELTGDAVTEVVGGSEELAEEDLQRRYTTYCDPRLNEKQALEMAFLIAGEYKDDE